MSSLLPQFKCLPDTFVVSFKTHHNSATHFCSKSREALHNIRAECILTNTSRMASATSSVFDIEKLFCCCLTKFSTPPAKLTNFCCFCSAVSQSSSPTPSSKSFAYRPAIILPGLGNNTKDYEKLALLLKDYGVPTVVVKVSRFDWFRNAAGLLDANYWSGTLRPRPVLDWYFKKMEEAISEANDVAEGGALSLIGHSAGGWLARVYMQEFEISNMSLLLTLGTPHLPPPKGLPGVIDQTRGLLNYVEKYCAKPVYTQELRYVCVAGRYVQGARLLDGATANENDSEMVAVANQSDAEVAAIVNTSEPASRTWRAQVIGQGYKQVCGEADAWGDGVVPVISAHLEGALNVTIEGVYHSPVGSDDVTRPWYGSPEVVKQWIHHLLT